MRFLNTLHGLMLKAGERIVDAKIDWKPLPDGMLKLGSHGEFRSYTSAERDAEDARSLSIIAQCQASYDYYKAAYLAELKRLLAG